MTCVMCHDMSYVQARNSIGTAEVNIHLHVHCEYISSLVDTIICIVIDTDELSRCSDLPEVRPLSYRVYSGEGETTELACRVAGYPEPMVSAISR